MSVGNNVLQKCKIIYISPDECRRIKECSHFDFSQESFCFAGKFPTYIAMKYNAYFAPGKFVHILPDCAGNFPTLQNLQFRSKFL